MTFYQKELEKINGKIYRNQAQIDSIIDTRKYIDTHFDSNVDLDTLSHSQFISKYHLLRLFKKYYGQTPQQYLTDKRMEKSKELLRNGMSVTSACFAVGFNSLGSFSSLFKRRTGLAPVEFKKRASFKKPAKLL